jgi:hypothetical protein
VVPSPLHRLDVHAFKERYPGLQVLCPPGILPQVSSVVSVQGGLTEFPPDPEVRLLLARGTGDREAILQAGPSLCFGDLIMNLTQVPGFDGFLFKLLGSVGSPRVTRIAKLTLIRDRRLVREQLEELAVLPGLARIIPTHGELVEGNAAAVLRSVAAKLG